LGIIRLGYKVEKEKTRRDGSTYTVSYPKQSDSFVLTDAPEVAAFYGETRELDVILPFPDIARNFDGAYTVWAGGVLVCKGDGEYVQYAGAFRTEEKNDKVRVYNASGDTVVSDGVAQVSFKWNGQSFDPGELVPCPGAAQDYYPHCRACKMSSILKVMMGRPELFRLGYYQIATGSGRNYDTILGTLELIQEQAGKVNGIPFKIRLVEEATTYRDNSGQRKSGKKWFLQLEPDPTFTRRLYANQAQALLGDGMEDDPAPRPESQEPVWDIVEDEAPPPFAETTEPAMEQGTTAESPPSSFATDATIAPAIIATGLTKNMYSYASAMKKSHLPADASLEQVTAWFDKYRDERTYGADSNAAALFANAATYVTKNNEVLGELGTDKLQEMLDQINAIDRGTLTDRTLTIKGHCELLVARILDELREGIDESE